MTLSDLATHLGCRLDGDGTLEVTRLSSLDEAEPGDLTFISNPKYVSKVPHTRATAIIAGHALAEAPCAILRSPNPYLTFAHALALLAPRDTPQPGIHPTAVVSAAASIDPTATVGALVVVEAGVSIGARTVVHPFVYVGHETRIGADCLVHAHASIRDGVTIGDRVVIQNAAVIGSDGYGFAPRADGTFEKVPQVGGVVIEDDVEIGAGVAVDRPPLGVTRIGLGTKLDNLVHVAHGVQVGRHVMLAGQVGIAGSTVIEDHVMLGGQVGVAGHITVGRAARATARSGIPNDVAPGETVSGYPAIANREWLKASAVYRRLPEMRRTIADLERRLAALEGARDDDAS